MPESSSDKNGDRDKQAKRNLPSWMTSKEGSNKLSKKDNVENSSEAKKKVETLQAKKKVETTEAKKKMEIIHDIGMHENTETKLDFSKLLDGVVFALSGFVNPERSTLRSQATEMGAAYRADWTSDCTLLVCAFSNTPKFKQVESENGTIVSKMWILECYKQRKLVDIEPYFMHVGKPWRKSGESIQQSHGDANKGQMTATHKEHPKHDVKPHAKTSGYVENHFSPSKVRVWALDDLRRTMSWLEDQEEKPEESELKEVAAQGIITCLQDAIEYLEQDHDVKDVIEQWKFVPHVVEELAQFDGEKTKGSLTRPELSKLGIDCKKIYEAEFSNFRRSSNQIKPVKLLNSDDVEYDSDNTIEMTEEEVDLAFRKLT